MKVSAAKNIDEIRDAGRECLEFIDQKKGLDPVLMDLRKVNSYLDFFIIVTGNSQIHCKSLAREAEKFLTSRGFKESGKPDYSSEWIILDMGELIVHVFSEETRSYYNLEKLWADAEILIFNKKGEL
jgi:ribosome-associated protein